MRKIQTTFRTPPTIGLPDSYSKLMTARDSEFRLELSRRKLLAAAGIGGGAAVAASFIGTGEAPAADRSSNPVTTSPIAGLHLQFVRMHR